MQNTDDQLSLVLEELRPKYRRIRTMTLDENCIPAKIRNRGCKQCIAIICTKHTAPITLYFALDGDNPGLFMPSDLGADVCKTDIDSVEKKKRELQKGWSEEERRQRRANSLFSLMDSDLESP